MQNSLFATMAGVTLPDLPHLPAALEAQIEAQLEVLGGQLVWRIGKDESSDRVVVRVGYASATPRFAHLPRLRSAGDAELQAALDAGEVRIEWVD